MILYLLLKLDLVGIIKLLEILFEVLLMLSEQLFFLLVPHYHFFIIWILLIEIILNLLKLFFLLLTLCLNLQFIFLLTRLLSGHFYLKWTFSLWLKAYVQELIFKYLIIIELLLFKVLKCFTFVFHKKIVCVCWSYFVWMNWEFGLLIKLELKRFWTWLFFKCWYKYF